MAPDPEAGTAPQKGGWRLFGQSPTREQENEETPGRRGLPKWNMGILNDRETIEVPGKIYPEALFRNYNNTNFLLGSVLLLAADHNEPPWSTKRTCTNFLFIHPNRRYSAPRTPTGREEENE